MKQNKKNKIVGVIDGIEIDKKHEFEERNQNVEKVSTPYLKINTKKSTNINRIEINKIGTQKTRKKKFTDKINVFAIMIGSVVFLAIVAFVVYLTVALL